MKKIIKTLFFCTFPLLVSAQQQGTSTHPNQYASKVDSVYKNFGNTGTFVLKGKVKNFKSKFFEFAVTQYTIGGSPSSVIVQADGSFNQSFPVVNSQSIFLYLNDDAVTFTVSDRDTIQINWDEKDFKKNFSVKSNQEPRNQLLQIEWQLYLKHRQKSTYLKEELSQNRDKYTEEKKYMLINNQFSDVVRTILTEEKKYESRNHLQAYNDLIVNEYYAYLSLLKEYNLLEKFNLKVKEDSSFTISRMVVKDANGATYRMSKYPVLDGDQNTYKIASEEYLKNVPEYRAFMYNYIRFNDTAPIRNHTKLVPTLIPVGNHMLIENYTLKYYYLAKASFTSPLIEDWFITQSIVHGFQFYSFSEVEEVYNKFLSECKIPYFKEIALQAYQTSKTLKPGLKAPAFTLKNDKGQNVSLNDFAGKVIYIDFWGVYCGPCISDIENYVHNLHEKFKGKDVVFLNICVDVNTEEWKKGLKKYKLDGVNLIAEGWVKNPVCKEFNINAIPHYVLINKDGTIANSTAPGPSEMLAKDSDSELSKALEK